MVAENSHGSSDLFTLFVEAAIGFGESGGGHALDVPGRPCYRQTKRLTYCGTGCAVEDMADHSCRVAEKERHGSVMRRRAFPASLRGWANVGEV
jgi:hypothetical protein